MDTALGYRVTAGMYRAETDIGDVVASRDLRSLCDLGLLIPYGEKRGRFYRGSPALLDLAQPHRRQGALENPYTLVRKSQEAAEAPQVPF